MPRSRLITDKLRRLFRIGPFGLGHSPLTPPLRRLTLKLEQLEDRTLPSAVSFADPATEFLGNGRGAIVNLQLDQPVTDQTVTVDFSVTGDDGNPTSWETNFAPGDTTASMHVLLPFVSPVPLPEMIAAFSR